MTPNDKVKAYDKAIEKSKEFYTKCKNRGDKDTAAFLESVFPELKVSEDEMMKGKLREILRLCYTECNCSISTIDYEKLFTWLEKQGEQPNKVSIWKHWKYGIAGNGEGKPIYLVKSGNTYMLSSCLGFECDYIELSELDKLYVEKQSEQTEINLVEILKHFPRETELYSPLYGKLWLAEVDEKNEIITCYKHHLEEGCTRAVLEQEETVSFYSNGTTGLPDYTVSKDCMLFLYDIEKQGEQKPTDKAKPKENNANEETNAPTAYGKYVDECLNDATKHFFSEGEDKYSVADLFYAGVRCGQSWIEKQRDNNNQNWEPSEEQLEASEYLENKNEQKNKINSYKIAVEITYEDILVLECAMKTIDLTGWDGANELYEKIVSLYNKIHNAYLLQLQDEQKSSVKAEPKFHEGEWITNGERTWFVEGVHNGFYDIISPEGHRTDDTIRHVDEYFHLWTIQDTKDGDVLAEDSCIFIIQKLGDNGTAAKTYCSLHSDGDFDDGAILYFDVDSTNPATKEQRDLLFQKMKDAGYEWDSEKKEPRKIKPKFNVGDWIVEPREDEPDYLWHIDRIEDDTYWYDAVNAGVKVAHADKNYHLWTINDANNGDVVVDKSCGTVGIFEGIGHHPDGGSYNDPSYSFLHCRYDDGYFYADFENGNIIMDSDDIIPATQEQRDILFQKIKEAGYEWDAEKKELRNYMLCNDTER